MISGHPLLADCIVMTQGFFRCDGAQVMHAEVEAEGLRREAEQLSMRCLTTREAARFQRFDQGPRKLEWLGGRIACKILISELIGKLELREIEIWPDAWGSPHVRIVGIGNNHPAPEISIAHSKGKVVAAMIPGGLGTRLGIDTELVKARSRSFILRVFTDAERLQLGTLRDDARDTILWWSLKESAFKALGLGLPNLMPQDVEILSISPTGHAEIVLHGPAKRRFDALEGTFIAARGLVVGAFAVSECVVRTGCSSKT